MASRLSALLHPPLISIAPVLLLAGANIGEIEFSELWLPIAAVLVLVLATGCVWGLLLRDVEKAAMLASLSMLFFLLHGHIHGAIVPDGAWSQYGHLAMLVIWLVVIGLTYWGLTRRKWQTEKLTDVLAIVAVVLVVMGTSQLVMGYIAKRAIANKLSRESVFPQEKLDRSMRSSPDSSSDLPDIYYLVLDGYGRGDQLATCYGYDNTEFLDFLSDTGFYVADQSHSNYAHTYLSLASSLNLRLVTAEIEEIRKHSGRELSPLYNLIRANDVGRYLQSKGYRFIHFNTWWGGTARSDIADTMIADASNYANAATRLITRDLSEFQRVFIRTTMLGYIVHALGFEKTSFSASPEHYLNCFRKLKEIPHMDGPTFTFAHIISPHPPYFFDRDGNFLDANPADRDWTKREAYIDQLIYLNGQVREIVREILASSDHEPIILIQADHGTASLLDKYRVASEQSEEFVAERMSILNAYYVPDSCRRQLYDSISPVNSFRVLLNGLFDEELPLLPDQVLFSWSPRFEMIDVTDRVRTDDSRPIQAK